MRAIYPHKKIKSYFDNPSLQTIKSHDYTTKFNMSLILNS